MAAFSLMTTAVLSAVLLLGPAPAMGQAAAPATASDQATADAIAEEARARQIARQFEANARVLTIFDRQGTVVRTVGEPGLYLRPAFSPDRTRLAVIKRDVDSDTVDLWVLDVATGNGTRITSNYTRQSARRRCRFGRR